MAGFAGNVRTLQAQSTLSSDPDPAGRRLEWVDQLGGTNARRDSPPARLWPAP